MSKQHNKLPERKQPSPAELIAACEADIVRVERLRDQHIDRGVELAERRRVASYAAHVQHDPESRKQLDAVNAEIGTHASELQSFDDALVEARAKLNNAQALLARAERKAQIKELQQRSKEYRDLGPFLDRATDHLRRGLIALKNNASVVGRDFRHVQMLHRVLSVALFDTPFRDAFGVPDANDRRTFSTFSGVVNGWCDSNDRALAHELEALDGTSNKQTEAA
jgi:hypothetical protein